MNCLRHVIAIGVTLIATTVAGCGDNQPPTTGQMTGQIGIVIQASPADVVSMTVTVSSLDFADIHGTLTKNSVSDWSGEVPDVPPGSGVTVTVDAFDGPTGTGNNTFEGVAHNVTVFAGKLTNVAITLKPTDGGGPVGNTPPHFVSLVFPNSILSSQTVTLFATADDPDDGEALTYDWSVLPGTGGTGGTFSTTHDSGEQPNTPVSTMYTPQSGFTGFVVIQVQVTDLTGAITTTSFPIAIGAGLLTDVGFDVLPDLTIPAFETQTLMPGGTSQILFQLSNPMVDWTPATMVVNTTWADDCGGTFVFVPDPLVTPPIDPSSVSIAKNNSVSLTFAYTAPVSLPANPQVTVKQCKLALTLVDAAGTQATYTVNVWVDPPMVMFVSSTTFTVDQFAGNWQTADGLCQDLAGAPGTKVPPGPYHALLSFDEISAKDRLLDAPYFRSDGLPIARNKDELYSTVTPTPLSLINPILLDENGTAVPVATPAFTGTNGDGTKGVNCNNWTSTDPGVLATVGTADDGTNPNWTNAGTGNCATARRIYCVQQGQQQN